jgi:hypothetical protein
MESFAPHRSLNNCGILHAILILLELLLVTYVVSLLAAHLFSLHACRWYGSRVDVIYKLGIRCPCKAQSPPSDCKVLQYPPIKTERILCVDLRKRWEFAISL